MASGRSYDINNYPLDEHGNGIGGERDRERGYEDHNESYLTYYSRKCWMVQEVCRDGRGGGEFKVNIRFV